MNEDEIKGVGRDALGKVKDAAGGLTGDTGLQAEGKLDQAEGKIQGQYGAAKDQLGSAGDGIAEKAADLIRLKDCVEDVVHAAPLAIHADRYLVALQGAGEVVAGELAAPSLRWGRLWSVLKISGRPWRASASSSASTQNSAPSVFDSRHANTARLTQSMMTTR